MERRQDTIFAPRGRRTMVVTASLVASLSIGVAPAVALAFPGEEGGSGQQTVVSDSGSYDSGSSSSSSSYGSSYSSESSSTPERTSAPERDYTSQGSSSSDASSGSSSSVQSYSSGDSSGSSSSQGSSQTSGGSLQSSGTQSSESVSDTKTSESSTTDRQVSATTASDQQSSGEGGGQGATTGDAQATSGSDSQTSEGQTTSGGDSQTTEGQTTAGEGQTSDGQATTGEGQTTTGDGQATGEGQATEGEEAPGEIDTVEEALKNVEEKEAAEAEARTALENAESGLNQVSTDIDRGVEEIREEEYSKVEPYQRAYDRAESDKRQADQAVSDAQASKNDYSRRESEAKQQVSTATSAAAGVTDETVAEARANLDSARQGLEDAERDLSSAEGEKRELQSKRQEFDTDAASTKAAVEDYYSRTSAPDTSATDGRFDGKAAQVRQAFSGNAGVQAAVDNFVDAAYDIAYGNESLTWMRKLVEMNERENASLDKEIAAPDKEATYQLPDPNGGQSRTVTRTEYVKALQDAADAAKRAVEAVGAQISSAEENVTAKQSALERAGAASATAKSDYDAAYAALQEAGSDTVDERAQAARTALDNYVAAVDRENAAKNALAEAQRSVKDLNEELASRQADSKAADAKLASETSRTDADRTAQVSDLETEKADIESEISSLRSKIATLEQKVADARTALSQAESDLRAAGSAQGISSDVEQLITYGRNSITAHEAAGSFAAGLQDVYNQSGDDKFYQPIDVGEHEGYEYPRALSLDLNKASIDSQKAAAQGRIDSDIAGLDSVISQKRSGVESAQRAYDSANGEVNRQQGLLNDLQNANANLNKLASEGVSTTGNSNIVSTLASYTVQPYNDAAAALRDAQAAYDQATSTTADMLRDSFLNGGTYTGDDPRYQQLNQYQQPYKDAYDAYGNARSAYDAAYRELEEARETLRRLTPSQDDVVPERNERDFGLDDTYIASSDDHSSYSNDDSGSSTTNSTSTKAEQTTTAKAEEKAATTLTERVEDKTMGIEVDGVTTEDVKVNGAPVLEQVADGVYNVVSMPELDRDLLAENARNENINSADEIENYWWYVYVDGVKIRVMDAEGNLAPGIERVIWATDIDAAQITFANGNVVIAQAGGMIVVLSPASTLGVDVIKKSVEDNANVTTLESVVVDDSTDASIVTGHVNTPPSLEERVEAYLPARVRAENGVDAATSSLAATSDATDAAVAVSWGAAGVAALVFGTIRRRRGEAR